MKRYYLREMEQLGVMENELEELGDRGEARSAIKYFGLGRGTKVHVYLSSVGDTRQNWGACGGCDVQVVRFAGQRFLGWGGGAGGGQQREGSYSLILCNCANASLGWAELGP